MAIIDTETALPARRGFTATRNACKLCTPLGACLAFAGIEGARTILHGSQGCSTYIRRYMISHFKEPIDIASSNFAESTTIFGGRDNLCQSVENLNTQYRPALIGVATTCLAETIGEDVAAHLRSKPPTAAAWPPIVHVSTPSYCGTHADGFVAAVRATVAQLAQPGPKDARVNVFAGMFSPADLRYLKEVLDDFHLEYTLLPDYSDTLDGPMWSQYQLIPPGGTRLDDIRRMGQAGASIEFSNGTVTDSSGAQWLEEQADVARRRCPVPLGVSRTDTLFELLEEFSGKRTPERHTAERGRLLDALIDGHKYVAGRRAIVVGEEELVVGIAAFLAEFGVIPVLCSSGGQSGRLRAALETALPEHAAQIDVRQAADFADLEDSAAEARADLVVGSSKAYPLARRLNLPLIRVCFPVHDRIGGSRILHLGYRGAQQLFDRVANALIEKTQTSSEVGYAYM